MQLYVQSSTKFTHKNGLITTWHLLFPCRHHQQNKVASTVYPNKYAHGFVVLCFVVVTQSFIMNSHEVFIHIHQGCLAGTGAIVRLPQCQWSKPDGYGKISQCITTTKHSKAKTVCIFLGIYCMYEPDSTLSVTIIHQWENDVTETNCDIWSNLSEDFM